MIYYEEDDNSDLALRASRNILSGNKGAENNMIICRGLDVHDTITTIDEWKEKCPPERDDYHWQDDRSAMELAKEWLNNNGQALKNLLNNHPDFQGINLIKASPEYETRFDKYGRGRKHDLIIIGEKENEKIVISVEAKVDEGFGNDTVESYYMKAILKRLSGVATNVPDRVEGLIRALFSQPYSKNIIDLQYQLLHAVAGTLAEAKKQDAAKAFFLVHTFKTSKMDAGKNKDNNKKLDKFVRVIGLGSRIRDGEVVGPITVPGNDFIPSGIPLYTGKIST